MKQNTGKESYSKSVREGKLTKKYILEIEGVLKKHLNVKEVAKEDVRDMGISENLVRLPIFIIKGDKSWQGLAVGFPGNTEELTTNNVGTPFLRILLYPMLELFQKISNKYHQKIYH